MAPLIKTGDVVYSVPRDRYRSGEIIALHHEGKLYVHRFYYRLPPPFGHLFLQKGDRVRGFTLSRLDQIKGKVIIPQFEATVGPYTRPRVYLRFCRQLLGQAARQILKPLGRRLNSSGS
ncbi:MAG: S24/S26 family peptidase [Deltaproteobacteria bacterium]|nr:S24/S26 family peptidase [Deltaproteobacteria bacterium]